MKFKTSSFIILIYGLCTFLYALLQTEVSAISSLVDISIRGLFICLFIFGYIVKTMVSSNKLNLVNILYLVLIFFCFAFSLVNGNEEVSVLYIILFMFLLSGSNYEDVLKAYAVATFAAVFFTLLLWKISVLPNNTNGYGKDFVGFYYATYGPNMLLHAIIAYIAYKKDKIDWKLWGFFIVSISWFYLRTTTLAPVLIVFGMLFLYIIFKNNRFKLWIYKNKVTRFILSHLAIILASSTILLQLAYNKYYENALFQSLNVLLSFRLTYGRTAFEKYGLSLFGQKLDWVHTGSNYFYLDSSYLNVLFGDGIIVLLIVCICMDIVNKYAVKNKLYYLQIAMIGFLIHCISDPQLVSFRYNPFFMLIVPAIYELRKNYRSLRS